MGEIVPDCQTGTEKTADTLFGAKMEKKMGSETCRIGYDMWDQNQ